MFDGMSPLPRLPREFLRVTGRAAPPYRKIHALALDGQLPAEFRNGRWFYAEADQAEIITKLVAVAAA